jgi:hypothetical protein
VIYVISLEVLILDRDKVVRRLSINEDLREEYIKRRADGNHDMITLWFFRAITGIFEPVSGSASGTAYPIIDVEGRNVSILIKFSGTIGDVIWNTFPGRPNRFWVVVGTDSTPPDPRNHRLGNKIAEALASLHADENNRIITLSAGFTFPSSVTIYEIGLVWECSTGPFGIAIRFLVDRTVFPGGISVGAGQTLSVVYRIVL